MRLNHSKLLNDFVNTLNDLQDLYDLYALQDQMEIYILDLYQIFYMLFILFYDYVYVSFDNFIIKYLVCLDLVTFIIFYYIYTQLFLIILRDRMWIEQYQILSFLYYKIIKL